MARTTTQLRSLWAPHCIGPWARVELHGDGAVTVRASIVDAVKALDACLVRYGYTTRKADTGAYNCRQITPPGKGFSLHAYGIGLDLNWSTNPFGPRLITDMPPAMVAAIKALRTRSGAQVWRWGGDFAGNKDAMHFEIVASPAEIATGIATAPPAPPLPEVTVTAPVVSFDLCEPAGPGKIRVAGWAYDPDEPGRSIEAHVHVHLIPGTTPQIVGIPCNVARSDVNAALGISGNHGFDTIIDMALQATVGVYPLDTVSGHGSSRLLPVWVPL